MTRYSTAISIVGLIIIFLCAPVHAQRTITGTLNVVWADPQPGVHMGGAIYTLENLDRATLPPSFAGLDRVRLKLRNLEGIAVHYFGKRVVVTGVRVANARVSSEAPEFSVESIVPIVTPQAHVQAASVFGTKKVIFLLLKFQEDANTPHPPVFYTDMTNPDTPPAGEVFPTTINAYFKKTSWNQFSWVADVGGVGGIGASGGWLTLPQPRSYYVPCTNGGMCTDLWKIGDDGTALGRAQGIDFTKYDNINFVLSNDLDCCAWGGGYTSSIDNKSYGATWEPPWGQETVTYAHEMGHSLGLPHSGWVYAAYDSPWDNMSNRQSASWAMCGSYQSIQANQLQYLYCFEPGNAYIAPYREYLGWIPPSNVTTTTSGSTLTVSLEGNALPLGSAMKMLKICLAAEPCTGGTAHYVTVEARVTGLGATSQYENASPGEGVLVHDFLGNRAPISGPLNCFWNSQSGWAVPIDSRPDYDATNCWSANGLSDAQFNVGETYINSTYMFGINVVSRSGSTFLVSLFPAKKRHGQITTQ